MGFSYVYKRFSPQDKALIPFNAHKQYNFVSSSAHANRVTHYSAQWTSESISLYSSSSAFYVVDTRNVMDETCYYNDIEPNDKGAKRIGKQIFNWLWYNNAFKELKGI